MNGCIIMAVPHLMEGFSPEEDVFPQEVRYNHLRMSFVFLLYRLRPHVVRCPVFGLYVSVTSPLWLFQGKMIMQDKLEKERNDAKNNVEEYVYEMRDKLHGVLEKFVNEAVSRDHTRGMKVEIKHGLWLTVNLFSLLVQHAGPRHVLVKTGGHGELAVWRRRGPTETSLHWQTGWAEGNRACRVTGQLIIKRRQLLSVQCWCLSSEKKTDVLLVTPTWTALI